jgi:hypothetical protein
VKAPASSVLDPALSTDRKWASVLHDAAMRALVRRHGPWEVRTAPGHCFTAERWLCSGLWHLQFFHRAAEVSVLSFALEHHVGPFVVRSSAALLGKRLDEPGLDRFLAPHGASPVAARLRLVTRALFEQACTSLSRSSISAGGPNGRSAC